MPLFFIIPIVAGGITLGATTVDVTQDIRASQAQQAQVVVFDPHAYASRTDCQMAAARSGVPMTVCNSRN